MKSLNILIIFMICVSCMSLVLAQKPTQEKVLCLNGKCKGKTIECPKQCPLRKPDKANQKACMVDCASPTCEAVCKNRIPNCNGFGSGCYDPRFIGGDGIVFYFHGKKDEHFALVSDTNLQINARFIGIRPPNRHRDFTWIQALGILFGSHSLSLDAAKTSTWDENSDHLKLTYDGQQIDLESDWESQTGEFKLERITDKNTVLISVPDVVEIAVKVVPITKEDDRVHSYNIPSDDCFAHLEVQFRFLGLSDKVDGVIGRTYRPDFVNPAKPGTAMAVLGGEDKFRTASLLSADCKDCLYDPASGTESGIPMAGEMSALKCSSGSASGVGIVCRK